jgi:sec-independent protein translocase protein TatA
MPPVALSSWQKVTFMNTTFAFLGMGGTEIMVVMVAGLVLFGAKKIPEFAKGLGLAIKEFKKASSDVSNELHHAINEHDAASVPPPPPAKPQAAPESAAPAATVPKS